MAAESTMVPLGTPLPAFRLPSATGEEVAAEDYDGRMLLVAFLSQHCPYVQHVEQGLGELLARHPELAVVGVCSNDTGISPDDTPDRLAEQAERAGWGFPYLVDESQEVGRAFGAACTPDFFLFDAEGRLAYRGAMDDSSPGNGRPVTGELLEGAIVAVGNGETVPEPHRPAMGCSIKWR
ncbi:thioredoxin family protein [Nocardioides coralli]|uniref:thioredoxin family protein n=1 Tax=Nocardioides coralli TaxID=2872154 RepID=UPI001CA4508C|nr:thioredoxin family protein [Nocardioides coralli]QZY29918.1 thioredoxin family protein [Nocardioides coralli]